ncbi:MAG: histidine kinase dimerization/phosphoacceptor domain -containing protein [Eubacteriales bacterium]
MKPKSLKNILTIYFILLIVAPILVISVLSFRFLTLNLEREITGKNLLLARSLAGEVEKFLNEPMNILGQVEEIIGKNSLVSERQYNTYLESVIRNYQFFEMIQVLDQNGVVRYVAPYDQDYEGTSMSGQSFFKNTMESGRPYWSKTFISTQAGQPTLTVTRPFERGIIVGYLNLGKLTEITERVKIGRDSYAGIADDEGTYIAHTNMSFVEQRTNIRDQGLNPSEGVYRHIDKGNEMLASVAVVSQTGWPVVICQSVDEAFAPVREARNIFMAGTIFALFLAVLMAIGILGRLLRPLAILAKKAKEIAGGSYNFSVEYGSFLEYDELAGDFMTMAGAIKSREKALKESEDRYALAVRGVNDGLWDWNIKTGEAYFSPRWKSMLGYEEDEITNRIEEWKKLVHPDDIGRVMEDIATHLAGLTPYYRNEHRLLHKDGSYRWILVRGIAVRDDNGEHYRAAGSHTDITERKKVEDQIKASLKEKEVLLREIHHRVKNNMQVISSLLRLQSGALHDETHSEMCRDSQNRVKSMSLIHEKLYQSEDLASIDFREYIQSLVDGLLKSYGTDPDRILLKIEFQDIRLGIDTAIPCGLLINEMVTNSLKHAFPGGRKGEIRIALRFTGKDEIELVMADSGIGMPENLDFRKTESLGLQLITTLAEEQLKGEIRLSREKGTEFLIRFREVIQ